MIFLQTNISNVVLAAFVAAVFCGCTTIEIEQKSQTVVAIETSPDKPSTIKAEVQAVTVSSSSDKSNEQPVNLPDKKPVPTSASSDTNLFL